MGCVRRRESFAAGRDVRKPILMAAQQRRNAETTLMLQYSACANVGLQIFDGKDGREKYPRRWIMLPPFF